MTNNTAEYFVMFILFCLFLLFVTRTDSEQSCHAPSQCSCIPRGFKCVGAKLYPKELNLHQKDYNFTSNKIGILPENSFNRFSELEYLYLQHNAISWVGTATFTHNLQLHFLDLSFNDISFLPENLFTNNKNLQEFFCSYNQLTKIGPGLFSGLSSLNIIEINNNQIAHIDQYAFMNNTHLSRLYLDNNRLTTPYKQWLKHFEHKKDGIHEIFMDGNPWSCDCMMATFKSWMDKHAWTAQDQLRTEFPRCLKNPTTELVCEAPRETLYNNCTVQPCDVIMEEASTGSIVCAGTGKPLPIALLVDSVGHPLTKPRRGNVSIAFDPVIEEDAERYTCILQGRLPNGKSHNVTWNYNVIVKPKPSAALAIVLLLVAVLIVIAATAFYVHKKKQRAGYASLQTDSDAPVLYDVNDDKPATQSDDVTYLQDDPEEEANYVRDSEKEVLV